MKLYLCQDGTYAGTQADAKLRGKHFEQVEVPTDKEGLISYLNQMLNAVSDLRPPEDQFTTVVERQDPIIERVPAPAIETAVALDEAFMKAKLGQQLTLAGIALENAFQRIGKENQPAKAPQGYKGTAPVVPDYVEERFARMTAETEEGGDDPLFS